MKWHELLAPVHKETQQLSLTTVIVNSLEENYANITSIVLTVAAEYVEDVVPDTKMRLPFVNSTYIMGGYITNMRDSNLEK